MEFSTLTQNQVYELLEQAELPFEYEHGAITFWVNGEKHVVWPVRWIAVIFTQYPVYSREILDIVLNK